MRVFEQPSRRENMILSVLPKNIPPLDEIAKKLLNKTIFINWPHLIEALVVGVSDSKNKISIVHPKPKHMPENSNFIVEDMNDNLLSLWNTQRKGIIEK